MTATPIIETVPTDPAPLVAAPPGEEETYAALLDALRRRRARVDATRRELSDVRAALGRFEAECQSRVGDLLADLRRLGDEADAVQRRLQDALATAASDDEDALDDILEQLDVEHDFRFDRADRGERFGGSGNNDDQFARSPFAASAAGRPAERATLKRLYRDLAKRCHPDLAKTDGERDRRAALMQRVNEAFAAGDAAGLRALLLETESEDPGFSARPLVDRMVWAKAEMARLDALLSCLRAELSSLHGSDLHRLWRRHETGAAVFDELADDLEARVRAEGQRLDRLIASFRRVEAGQRPHERVSVTGRH